MKNSWKFYLLLSFVLVFLFLFLLYPLTYILRESVLVEMNGKTQFSLIYFKLFGQSPFMLEALLNSLIIAIVTTFLCLCISLPLAHLFCRYRFPGKTLWQGLLMAPLILPPFVGGIGIQQFFAKFGTLNHLLGLVGPDKTTQHPIDWIAAGGIWGVVLMQTLHLFPILYFNISAAFMNLSPTTEEAALSLGAPRSHVFRTITFPLMMPGIFSGAVIVFVWAFTDLGTPLIFGLNKVVAVQIFDKVNETGFNPFGYTLVIIVLLITVFLFLISRFLLFKHDYVTMLKGENTVELPILRGAKLYLASAGLIGIFILTILPHIMVVLQSVSGRWMMSAFPQVFTAKPYLEVILLPQALTGMTNSFIYSILSALLDIVLGVLIAYWLSRKDFVGKNVLDALTILPLALPGVVLAFGYVVSFNVPATWHGHNLQFLKQFVNPRENPVFLLVIGYSVRRLPYIVRSAYAGFQQVSASMEEASRNLGATPFKTCHSILLPLIKNNLIAGGILTFAFAFLEVSDSLILAMKEKYYPVTKAIFMLLGRIEPGASAVACALGVLGMLLLCYALYLATSKLGKKVGNLFG